MEFPIRIWAGTTPVIIRIHTRFTPMRLLSLLSSSALPPSSDDGDEIVNMVDVEGIEGELPAKGRRDPEVGDEMNR